MVTTAMAPKQTSLEKLRQEIDVIDDALHDLLIKRAEATRAVAELKRSSSGDAMPVPAMRPAREAQILRRLLARHKGDMPPSVVVRIWREIISASLQAQAKFELHVFGGENQGAYFDLAHAYFGALTPIRGHARASLVLHACSEDPDSIGVVPLPEVEETGTPWWTQLAASGHPGPRVIARLPFVADGDEPHVSAFVVGGVEQEPSGDDTTLLRLEARENLSRARLTALLKEAGFDAKLISAGRSKETPGAAVSLIAAAGFVPASDPRLGVLRAGAGEQIASVATVGGFANPMPAAREAR
jgi:chorismate mutase-like protein